MIVITRFFSALPSYEEIWEIRYLNISCLFSILLRCFKALLATRWFSKLLSGNSLRRRSGSMYEAGTSGHV